MTNPRAARSWWSRRDFLKTSVAAAAGAYGMRWGLGLAADIPAEFDGSKFQLAAPEPNPKHGGVVRIGIPLRPPHFDIHQSGTFFNIGSQGCMFDNLIRRDPRDSGKTIIPDLAHSWQIAKDGKTYTFHLRQGVHFHDGAELTAEDVKATFDRIIKPPQGVSIPRSILFKAVSEIAAPDKYTVQFKLAEPRPVKSVKRVENESWTMEKNKDYWNKGLPYLDGVEFYHVLPFSAEMGSAILSGRVDYVRVTDPGTARKAKATPGMTTADYYQSVIQATWVNNKRKPLDDPRVRRAMHLVLDKPVLVDVVKDVAPMMVGGFIYPFSEFATPKEELAKRVGYQVDQTAAVKEARALMAAAGYANGIKGLDYMVREIASFKVWSQAIQAMLQESLNIESKLRTVVDSVWFDDAKNGNFDLAIGAIVSTLLDPSDYFNAWYGKDGPQNYSFWDNKELTALTPRIDQEVDASKRLALIRQAEAIMEQDPPLLPVSWEKINEIWYSFMKGHNPYEYFGLYDVGRFDTVWLDKA